MSFSDPVKFVRERVHEIQANITKLTETPEAQQIKKRFTFSLIAFKNFIAYHLASPIKKATNLTPQLETIKNEIEAIEVKIKTIKNINIKDLNESEEFKSIEKDLTKIKNNLIDVRKQIEETKTKIVDLKQQNKPDKATIQDHEKALLEMVKSAKQLVDTYNKQKIDNDKLILKAHQFGIQHLNDRSRIVSPEGRQKLNLDKNINELKERVKDINTVTFIQTRIKTIGQEVDNALEKEQRIEEIKKETPTIIEKKLREHIQNQLVSPQDIKTSFFLQDEFVSSLKESIDEDSYIKTISREINRSASASKSSIKTIIDIQTPNFLPTDGLTRKAAVDFLSKKIKEKQQQAQSDWEKKLKLVPEDMQASCKLSEFKNRSLDKFDKLISDVKESSDKLSRREKELQILETDNTPENIEKTLAQKITDSVTVQHNAIKKKLDEKSRAINLPQNLVTILANDLLGNLPFAERDNLEAAKKYYGKQSDSLNLSDAQIESSVQQKAREFLPDEVQKLNKSLEEKIKQSKLIPEKKEEFKTDSQRYIKTEILGIPPDSQIDYSKLEIDHIKEVYKKLTFGENLRHTAILNEKIRQEELKQEYENMKKDLPVQLEQFIKTASEPWLSEAHKERLRNNLAQEFAALYEKNQQKKLTEGTLSMTRSNWSNLDSILNNNWPSLSKTTEAAGQTRLRDAGIYDPQLLQRMAQEEKTHQDKLEEDLKSIQFDSERGADTTGRKKALLSLMNAFIEKGAEKIVKEHVVETIDQHIALIEGEKKKIEDQLGRNHPLVGSLKGEIDEKVMEPLKQMKQDAATLSLGELKKRIDESQNLMKKTNDLYKLIDYSASAELKTKLQEALQAPLKKSLEQQIKQKNQLAVELLLPQSTLRLELEGWMATLKESKFEDLANLNQRWNRFNENFQNRFKEDIIDDFKVILEEKQVEDEKRFSDEMEKVIKDAGLSENPDVNAGKSDLIEEIKQYRNTGILNEFNQRKDKDEDILDLKNEFTTELKTPSSSKKLLPFHTEQAQRTKDEFIKFLAEKKKEAFSFSKLNNQIQTELGQEYLKSQTHPDLTKLKNAQDHIAKEVPRLLEQTLQKYETQMKNKNYQDALDVLTKVYSDSQESVKDQVRSSLKKLK